MPPHIRLLRRHPLPNVPVRRPSSQAPRSPRTPHDASSERCRPERITEKPRSETISQLAVLRVGTWSVKRASQPTVGEQAAKASSPSGSASAGSGRQLTSCPAPYVRPTSWSHAGQPRAGQARAGRDRDLPRGAARPRCRAGPGGILRHHRGRARGRPPPWGDGAGATTTCPLPQGGQAPGQEAGPGSSPGSRQGEATPDRDQMSFFEPDECSPGWYGSAVLRQARVREGAPNPAIGRRDEAHLLGRHLERRARHLFPQ